MSDTRKPSPAASPQEKFDADFDAFLHADDSRLTALYRKLPHPEPDAALDARVRAQAHRALHDGGDTATQARPLLARRGLPAFGAAAALVLVAGLAWRLMPPAVPTREAASAADTAEPVVVQSERAAPVPAPAAPPAQPAAPQASADASALYKHKLHRTIAAKPEIPTAADKARAEPKPAANDVVAAAPKMAAPAATPPANAEPSAFPPRVAGQPRAKSVPPPATAAALPPPPPAATAAEAETARSGPTVAAAPSPAPREAASAERAASTLTFADGAAAGGSAFAVRPDPSAPARYRWEIADDAAAAPTHGVYPPDPPPPQAWVEIVRAMLRDGHGKEARQAFSELRRSHPDFSVPADLRGLE